MTTETGRPSGGGQPATLAELIEALTSLPSLDPVERAAACPILDKAARVLLADIRADAMTEAVSGAPGERLTEAELARRLGVGRAVVNKRVKK